MERLILGVRPESFTVTNPDAPLKMRVDLVEELGADTYVYCTLPGDEPGDKRFIIRFHGRIPPRIGENIAVEVRSTELHAFHPRTGERLG
jgi:multiple sugar transport system ATP-binding protein